VCARFLLHSIVGDIVRSMHKINAPLDGGQADHQSTIGEIEAKIFKNNVSILIDPVSILIYIAPNLVELKKLKKVKHGKPWLVQLATGTKREVT
jgi:hypothetical protein